MSAFRQLQGLTNLGRMFVPAGLPDIEIIVILQAGDDPDVARLIRRASKPCPDRSRYFFPSGFRAK